jgi:hypothetical protein
MAVSMESSVPQNISITIINNAPDFEDDDAITDLAR